MWSDEEPQRYTAEWEWGKLLHSVQGWYYSSGGLGVMSPQGRRIGSWGRWLSLTAHAGIARAVMFSLTPACLYSTSPTAHACNPTPSVLSTPHWILDVSRHGPDSATCFLRPPSLTHKLNKTVLLIRLSSHSGVISPNCCFACWESILLAGKPYFQEDYYIKRT